MFLGPSSPAPKAATSSSPVLPVLAFPQMSSSTALSPLDVGDKAEKSCLSQYPEAGEPVLAESSSSRSASQIVAAWMGEMFLSNISGGPLAEGISKGDVFALEEHGAAGK